MYNVNVIRELSKISIYRLDHPVVVSNFLKAIYHGRRAGFKDFQIDVSNVEQSYPIYPNACVPIAGVMQYYKRMQEFSFEPIGNIPEYLEKTAFFSPLASGNDENQLTTTCLDRIWEFSNSQEVSKIVNNFLSEVSKTVVYEQGVLEGLEWCLNEIMDNVIQHSQTKIGFIMAQIHRQSNHIACCIFDYGQGIFNSLKNTPHAPRNRIDAITQAIQKGVTRDTSIGQGNGMWGLHQILHTNEGRLCITTNGASWLMLSSDQIKTFTRIPYISKEYGATIVDFQLDPNRQISMNDVMGHTPVNLYLESFEDDQGNLHYSLKEQASGTGTRESGERIRNEVINLQKSANRILELDFSGISVISSSFADELIGKLALHYGFYGFNQVIRLTNMNPTIQAIVQHSVAQRMGDFLNGNKA